MADILVRCSRCRKLMIWQRAQPKWWQCPRCGKQHHRQERKWIHGGV